MTRLSDAALATEHLLVKVGSDADHVAVMAAVTDVPVGTVPDTPGAAEEEVAVNLLGAASETLEMIAGEAVAAGVRVFAAADGKVNDLSAVAGTYFCVGTALEAAAADGDEIEVDPCIPYPVVVT
jgi:hypothetical protein